MTDGLTAHRMSFFLSLFFPKRARQHDCLGDGAAAGLSCDMCHRRGQCYTYVSYVNAKVLHTYNARPTAVKGVLKTTPSYV